MREHMISLPGILSTEREYSPQRGQVCRDVADDDYVSWRYPQMDFDTR